MFNGAGYAALAPRWPRTTRTRSRSPARPEIFANKSAGRLADHFAAITGGLTKKPAVVGHTLGGLLTQMLAGRGLSAASVAIDAAPFRGAPAPLGAEVGAGPRI